MDDKSELAVRYDQLIGDLRKIADDTILELNSILDSVRESFKIDGIAGRVKSKKSFIAKALRTESGVLSYPNPFMDIQDLIGTRVVVYYKQNLLKVKGKLLEHLNEIEVEVKKPASPSEFDYEGVHLILHLPVSVRGRNKSAVEEMSGLFELQIKTLFQHSWAQTEHGLGYKPGEGDKADPDPITARKLAFVAAQAWGADHILEDLVNSMETQGT